MQYLETFTATEVLDRVRTFWDFSTGVPLPKEDFHCPLCRSTEVLIRRAGFHTRSESDNPYRCILGWKCTVCSYIFGTGIPITEQMYQNARDYTPGGALTNRTAVKEYIEYRQRIE